MLAGLDSGGTNSPAMTWEFVDRLKNATRMKLVLKGLQTAEDAALACSHGVDGIVVSNHGGRAEDGGRATIEILPEVIAEVRGRIPVLVDSGFRRGTDVFKALAMLVRQRWALGGHIYGVWARSGKPAWNGCWRFSARS